MTEKVNPGTGKKDFLIEVEDAEKESDADIGATKSRETVDEVSKSSEEGNEDSPVGEKPKLGDNYIIGDWWAKGQRPKLPTKIQGRAS